MRQKYLKYVLPLVLFLIAFLFLPINQLNWLESMPGDIGDARLNNYFLENIYQYLNGNVESLWHLSFYYPFPYTLGFSDNLFGSSPIYLLTRYFGFLPDTAFQIWYLFGYIVNFTSAFYVLRKLGKSSLAASIGALIFAFALPTTAHVGHAQLQYRFGIPLAIFFLIKFLDKKDWSSLIVSGLWLVWQFYAGIYIGFFTLFLMLAMVLTYIGYEKFWFSHSFKSRLLVFISAWKYLSRRRKFQYVIFSGLLLFLMVLLFYPYLQVSLLYGAKRSWDEISVMLPRLQSYILSDASYLWSSPNAEIFSDIPMRHEHQMFFGLLPLLLAATGLFVGNRQQNGLAYTLMAGMLGLVFALTLYVGGFSLWYFMHKLPLASAIRAMTRLDLALLIVIAYFSAVTVDFVRSRYAWGTKIVSLAVLPLLILEFSMTSMYTSKKDDWRDRISQAEKRIPEHLPQDSIIFMAQKNGSFYVDELDAMWVSLMHGMKSLNGYSGLLPAGYTWEFGNDCAEMPVRIISYTNFSNLAEAEAEERYKQIISRVVPLGFSNCNSEWLYNKPKYTMSDRVYTADEIKDISFQIFDGTIPSDITVKIMNAGNINFSARSSIGKPFRVAWRFLDVNGIPMSGWDNRKDLPFDIPAKGVLEFQITVNPPPNTAMIEVSMVQELEFWFHDVGVTTVTLPVQLF
ncbi:MAG: hypothetical protein GX143_06960 [Alcaligenaceae bacterium]|jgi:hypothetical protein|nr:hypothetical protein [Alcaligenaceae bacterium]